MHYRSWIELSRSALRANVLATQKVIGRNVHILPVVKANAYGHGLKELISLLRGLPIWGVGVAYGQEALRLRALGYHGRILVLSYWSTTELQKLIQANIDLVVWDGASLRAVQGLPRSSRASARVHLKLDTGTTRLGFRPEDIQRLTRALQASPINVVGLFSHFANSEAASSASTFDQLKRFTTLDQQLGLKQGIVRHIACTAAGLRYPEARFGLLRLGIGLYGLWPSSATKRAVLKKNPRFRLTPVASWYSRISQVKTVPAGTAIGYGSSYRTAVRSRIALIPVGYADGYDRRLSNRGWVMIGRRRAPIRGRICMNLMMVDITAIPTARRNDQVTLLGSGMTADTMAELCGTIAYEITTRINPELPRIITS